MKYIIFMLGLIFSVNVSAVYQEPADMNLGFRYEMYDCINGDICFTKEDGFTYSIDGNILGEGDRSLFMVYEGKVYLTETDLPLNWQIYRNEIKVKTFFQWKEFMDMISE